MKKILLLLTAAALLCSNSVMFAQEAETPETSGRQFYVEFGGPGILFSANLQSRLNPKVRFGWGYRAGVGYFYGRNYDGSDRTVYNIPLGVNYIFGKANSLHTFEAGGGVTILTKGRHPDDTGILYGAFPFMYRYIPVDGGFTWAAGLIPILEPSGEMNFTVAFNFGFSF